MTKTNTLAKLVLICGLTAATFGATSVMAKGDGYHQKHSHARFLLSERGAEKLNLTDDQQTKLKAIFVTQKAQIKALRGAASKETRKAERELHKAKMEALFAAAKFDENAAIELLDERHAKAQQVSLIKLKGQHQIMQVLNTEQKEKLAQIQKHMGKKRHSK